MPSGPGGVLEQTSVPRDPLTQPREREVHPAGTRPWTSTASGAGQPKLPVVGHRCLDAVGPAPKGSGLSLGHIPEDPSGTVCAGPGPTGCSQPPRSAAGPARGSFIPRSCRAGGQQVKAGQLIVPLPGRTDLQLAAFHAGRPALPTTVTRKGLGPDPALESSPCLGLGASRVAGDMQGQVPLASGELGRGPGGCRSESTFQARCPPLQAGHWGAVTVSSS